MIGREAFIGENALVEAFSQQSRFYEETIETLSKEVDLQQVNINIGGQPLLQDTRLWFKSGTMYGLIGRNGTGKSTLLKVIGRGELIGFPLNSTSELCTSSSCPQRHQTSRQSSKQCSRLIRRGPCS